MSIDVELPTNEDPENPDRKPPPPLIPPRTEGNPEQDPGDLDDGKPAGEE